MNKSQLESKHIAELHDLAAEAGIERYRMLTRNELIAKLADGEGKAEAEPRRERPPARRRERKPREQRREPKPEPAREQRRERKPEREPETEPQPTPTAAEREAGRPKRKRRRRWGRRRKHGGSREHADRWLEAWNAHDLEQIVACYSEQVDFVMPAVVGDSEERRIVGRAALRDHFRHGLELAPNLAVTEESLLEGPGGFAILYRREDGHRAIETVELDDSGLAARVRVFYEREQS